LLKSLCSELFQPFFNVSHLELEVLLFQDTDGGFAGLASRAGVDDEHGGDPLCGVKSILYQIAMLCNAKRYI